MHVWSLNFGPADYDALLARIGDAEFVLLGEASHGTHEFYSIRADITRRLIQEKQFTAVAVEADWPDAYRVNRYVRGEAGAADAADSLSGFTRFPVWMWRNADVLAFIGWMRHHNEHLPSNAIRAGFYGLDLYSLYTSIDAVLQYLEKIDPDAARRARSRYGCFEHFGEDVQQYGYAAEFGLTPSCEQHVIAELLDMRQKAAEYAARDGLVAADEFFYAEQNARLVRNAENYYRSMFRRRTSSWNLRDQHMAETLDSLYTYLKKRDGHAKIVLWAHNSHVGDARATEMGESGELNIGQLCRERYGSKAVLVGFTTYMGTVTAASGWGEPAEIKAVRPGLNDSYEALFHGLDLPAFMLIFNAEGDFRPITLPEPMLERAIGVVYAPATERMSHYFYAKLSSQFDAVIHIDRTRAVEPLEHTAGWKTQEWETYPTGM